VGELAGDQRSVGRAERLSDEGVANRAGVSVGGRARPAAVVGPAAAAVERPTAAGAAAVTSGCGAQIETQYERASVRSTPVKCVTLGLGSRSWF
jgi:hypothetical protein